MATTLEFDLEALLAPIPGDSPTGVDLRLDDSQTNPWGKIADHRKAARNAEDMLAYWDSLSDFEKQNGPPKPNEHWQALIDEGTKILQRRSKDLAVVAHMIEGWVRTEGFIGVAKGFQLANELIERFWGELFPKGEDGDLYETVHNLAQLNSEDASGIVSALGNVPITHDPAGDSYALWQYVEAHRINTLDPEKRQRRIDRGAITLDLINRSVKSTSDDFFQNAHQEIQQIVAELDRLDQLLLDRLPDGEQPSFRKIREKLDETSGAIQTLAPQAFITTSNELVPATAGGMVQGHVVNGHSMVVGAVASREDAFKQLTLIADFFERTEPLSLLSEQIRKVVHLGRMNPLQYFSELIEDEAIRKQMFKLVGIKPPNEDS